MTARLLLLAALCAAGCATNRDYETVRVALDLSCPPETLAAWRAAQADSAGCATTNGGLPSGLVAGGLELPASGGRATRPYAHALSLTDSSALTFTAPSFGSLGCEADTSRPLHGGQRVYLLRLRGQVPNYWRGMMQTVAGMDSVRLLTTPEVVWSASVPPGMRCSVRVGPGQYVAEVVGQRCPRWRIVVAP